MNNNDTIPVGPVTHDPSQFFFDCVIHEQDDYGQAIGLGMRFRTPDGQAARQAIGVQQGATMAEIGASLEALGKFFQNPDHRLVMGGHPLKGSELPAPASPPELTVVK